MNRKMILEVNDLKVYYKTIHGSLKAVDGISFDLAEKEAFGIVGESGCGKTTAALSTMRLLPPNASIINGKILFDGNDIISMSNAEIRKIRWKKISMVFQSSMNALNPVIKIGDQIAEAILIHENISKKEAKERVNNLVQMVGIEPTRLNNYPHEFSGGMKQRAVIAMALACYPNILIADEPTTALDVIVQAKILKLLKDIQNETGIAIILITHDLSVVAETCDRVTVMYAGRIVEEASVSIVMRTPKHPYTQGLLNSFPNLIRLRTERLSFIPGAPPSLLSPPRGCRFYPRCNYRTEKCTKTEPELLNVGKDHKVACHLYN